MGLALEAIVVGAVLAGALVGYTSMHGSITRDTAAGAGLVLGVLIHVGFELAGANGWYCLHGAACRT